MPSPSERTISIEQLWYAINRHKLLGLVVFTLIFGTVVAGWLLLPKKYGSEGRIVVRLGRANLGVNTTPDGATSVSIQDTRETEIKSVEQLVQSHEILGRVVDTVGMEKILSNTIELPINLELVSDVVKNEVSDKEYARLRRREKAIKRLGKEIKVDVEKKSSNISVYCTGASPRIAQRIVDEIMEQVQKLHVEVHAVDRSKSHFERGLEDKTIALQERMEAQEAFRSEHQVFSIAEERNTQNAVADKLKNQMVDIRIDLRQSLAKIRELEIQMSDLETEYEMPRTGMERASTEGAQEQYYARIGEKSRLLAKYSNNHPRIAEINSEIQRLEAEIASLPTDRVERDKVRNPVFEELQVELLKERSIAKSFELRLEQVRNEYDESVLTVKKLNRLQVEAACLQQEIDSAQQEYQIYVKKRNESQLIDQLDKESISDIVIQQPASLVLKKHSPKGSILLPLGFALGAFAGMFAAIFADRKNLTKLTTPEEIEEALDLPVLVSIPRVHSSRVLTN